MFKELLIILKFSIYALFLLPIASSAQSDSLHAPYLINKSLPVFKIMKAPDSSAFLLKDLKHSMNTVFFVFNPDCEFCQHETRDLLKNIAKFKNTQIIMVSYMPYDMINDFYKEYKISRYPLITMGKDNDYLFLKFFKLKILPSTIVYDSNGKFKKIFRERVDMEMLLKEL